MRIAMWRSVRTLIALGLVLLPQAADGQEVAEGPRRNQAALEVGYLSGGLSYARRIGDTPFSGGVGVWGAWEPPGTFDRSVWEPLGLTVFARYRASEWLHADVGLTGARYLWADDCSDCSGTFVGVRTAVLVGRGRVFIGPELAAGRASDDRHGAELGILWGAQLRIVHEWGS